MSTGPAGATTPQEVLTEFDMQFGDDGTILTTYGIIVEPGDTACYDLQRNTGGQYGDFAAELAAMTGGVTGSICDSDYGPTLQKIGERVQETLTSVQLSHPHEEGTVSLQFIPSSYAVAYSVSGNKVTFARQPKKGTIVNVTYIVAGN